MGRYNFVGPMGPGNPIEEFFIQREMEERMRMLDAQRMKEGDTALRQRDEEMDLRRQEEERRRKESERRDAEQARAGAMDEAEQRARMNTVGVRQMIGQRIGQPMTPDDARTISGMAYSENVPVPGIVEAALQAPKRSVVQTTDARGNPIRKSVTEDELIAGVPEYQAPKAAPAQEPLVAIMGPDGNPVYVPRGQAVGQRPASSREQGRPVTSSDAGRVADLDTSLDDLAQLRTTLTETAGATGTMARMGAALPNVVTEFTGLGEESKQRQGVIDRVKQVIGKALEGGVLRKEDEAKYEKILPTLADDPQVAKSKLDGLEAALIQRRSTFLDSLGDAGYETGNYTARQQQTQAGGKTITQAQIAAIAKRKGLSPDVVMQQAQSQGYRVQ